MRPFLALWLAGSVWSSVALALEPLPWPMQKKAEEAFARGIQGKNEPDQARKYFQEAAAIYFQLYQQGFHNADLCCNWGNAELLADRLPQAILAWRLGLQHSPANGDLLANLEYARDQVEYPPGNVGRPEPDPWPAWLPWPSLERVLLTAFLFYVFTWCLGTAWLIRRNNLWLLLTGCCGLISAALLAGAIFLNWNEQENRQYPLVVIEREHTFHRGNGTSYPPHEKVTTLRPGMEARLLFQRGEWVQIELPGNHIGWVPRENVLVAPGP